ncbi:LANO_0D08900g1_1 [Lachancea nothofagi CBS 11611]|uniref:Conserved oligomeric Golgi complex subunit 4 n=1 Tax=Lachancea nothofagi CBS 11611 TaxID=1266666 RepID=A0A1G4JJD8_9SACH|nr:LANO_0D08900g1_1 [Lachancea nothofagi CBS 11611]
MLPTDSQTLDTRLSTNLAKYHTVLSKISTVSQLAKLQAVISNEHSTTLKSLDDYVQPSHTSINQNVRALELQRTKLTQTLSKLHHALEDISISRDLAQQISSRIRSVDNERQRVAQTLQFVSHVQILKNNISMAHGAIERSDYKLAATSIDAILKLPPTIISSRFANKVVPSAEIPEDPLVLVEQWTNQLSKAFQEKFESAARNQDVSSLTSIFQLFPLIQKSNLGLDLYSRYVCDIIATQSRKLMTGAAPDNTTFYARALLHLFKIVSTIINEHSKIITECYGKEHMVHIMTKVQREADMQAGLVLDSFLETRKVEEVIQSIQKFEKLSSSPDEPVIEPPAVGRVSNIINEYSMILQNWSMYCRFFALKWYEFGGERVNEGEFQLPAPIFKGNFYSKIHNSGFLSSFQALVRYYLSASFTKTISLESLPSLNQYLTKKPYKHDDVSSYAFSSIVEDLTLIIRNCLIVNVNTGQSQLLGQFLDFLARFLQNEYLIKFLQHNLRQLQPRLTSNIILKKHVPPIDSNTASRAASPGVADPSKLSNLRFNFKGAASSALSNIQSNIQAVYADEESVLKLHEYLIYVNTLSIGGVFLQKLLSKELLQDRPQLLNDNFPFSREAQVLREKIEATEQNLLAQNNKLLQWAVKQLFENLLQPRIRKMLGALFVQGPTNEYFSSAVDFEDMSHLHQFSTDWTEFMMPYVNVLYKSCYAQLLSCIVDFMVAHISSRIWSLQVNELGSIKLDRELSSLIALVCDDQYVLREKFIKLTQIVLIAGFEDDDFDPTTKDLKREIVDSINWVLTPAERIRAGELRIDKRR